MADALAAQVTRPLELAAPKVDEPITFHVWCSACGKSRDFDAASPVGVSRLAVLTGCPVPKKCALEYRAGTLEQWLDDPMKRWSTHAVTPQ